MGFEKLPYLSDDLCLEHSSSLALIFQLLGEEDIAVGTGISCCLGQRVELALDVVGRLTGEGKLVLDVVPCVSNGSESGSETAGN